MGKRCSACKLAIQPGDENTHLLIHHRVGDDFQLEAEPTSRAESDRERPSLALVSSMPAPVESQDWVVEGIARPGSIVVIASAEGLGKSYVRKETELRLGSGSGPLFGRFDVRRPYRVATFEEENGEAEEWRRDEQVLASLGLTRASLGDRVHRVSYPGLDLTKTDSQEYVREQVSSVGAEVVWLDTGGSMVGEEWGEPMKLAYRFLRELGMTVFLNVHLVKPARGQSHGPSHGSSITDVMGQWTRQADAVLLMSDLGEGRARVLVRKRVPKLDLVMAQKDGLWVVVAEGAGTGTEANTERRVLRAIGAGADSAASIAAALGIGERSVYRAVGVLRKDGQVADRTPYRLTPEGEEAVGDEL
jgi:hypothetical protein